MTVTATVTSLLPVTGTGSVEKIWDWFNDSREFVFDDFSPTTLTAFADELAVRAKSEITWVIDFDGEPVGYLGFAPHNPVCGQFRGLVIAPEFRGRGIGTQALTGAMEFLRSKGFRQFISMPFADNYAVKRMLLRSGFESAGTLYDATRRGGKPLSISIFQFREAS